MRQRKAKDLEKRLANCSPFIIDDFEEKFWGCENLYVEIGSGKGQFIIKKALMHPEANFLGIEGQETVILRAAEKAMAVSGKTDWPENVPGKELMQFAAWKGCKVASEEACSPDLSNLKFACCFVDNMQDFFGENQLEGIFLNFSDPWPKERHAKRRLTYHKRLMDYAWAIKNGGFIEFKTDNDDLFEFSSEEFRLCGSVLQIVEMSRDLHGKDSELESAIFTTEYEDKFSGRGKNINYIKAIVNRKNANL